MPRGNLQDLLAAVNQYQNEKMLNNNSPDPNNNANSSTTSLSNSRRSMSSNSSRHLPVIPTLSPITYLPWTTCLHICLSIAKGVAYLHSFDPPIIHRDLKSPNILVRNYSEYNNNNNHSIIGNIK